MIYDSLQNYVQLRQGFAINKATDSFVSNEQSQEFPYPLLRIADMINGKYAKYVSKKIHKSVIVNQNDLIYTRTGQIGLVFTGFEGVLHNNSFIVDVIDDKIDKQYLYTALQSSFVRQQALTLAKNSVQPDLTHDMFKKIIIPFPSKDIQYKIAGIIGAINKKIVLNNRVNATLEAMAKTLYDYWFVQFDFPDEKGRPYKTSGGKMVYNEELGREIPAGWEAGNLNVIAEYINGLACQRFRPQENENALPVVKIREIHEGIQADTERVSVNIPEENIIEDGDILFSWSATLEVNYWIGGKAGLNQHIFKVQPKEGFNREYVYHQLREYVINFVKIAEARKTTMGHITQDHLNFSRIPIPPRPVLSSFQTQMRPLHEKMSQSKKENHRLVALRDWLLPMLMNGQVRFRKGYF